MIPRYSLLQGFDVLGYKEHTDYVIIESANPDLRKAVVRINVYHAHRQTIQYIEPRDANLLSQAELLVIDEAAAIPMPQVKGLTLSLKSRLKASSWF